MVSLNFIPGAMHHVRVTTLAERRVLLFEAAELCPTVTIRPEGVISLPPSMTGCCVPLAGGFCENGRPDPRAVRFLVGEPYGRGYYHRRWVIVEPGDITGIEPKDLRAITQLVLACERSMAWASANLHKTPL